MGCFYEHPISIFQEVINLLKKWVPYLLLLPTFIIIGFFIYYPAIMTFKMSAYRVSPFGNKVIYIGLKNFHSLFSSQEYMQVLSTTLIFVAVTVGVGLAISLLIALLLNEKVPGIGVFRTLMFAPYAISPAVAGTLWAFLLSPAAGYISYIFLEFFGIQPQWLTSYPLALVSIMMATIWKNLGFNIIFFLAGIQSIPKSYYEAATIDGANAAKRLFKITIPLVSPVTFYLVIMNIIFTTFSVFGTIDIMTQGGPGSTTTTLIYKLYRDGFVNYRTGLASTESIILLIIMSVFTYIYFKFAQRAVHYQ